MMPGYGGGVGHRTCRMYWCYECARALRIISYPSTDVFCPRCYGRFLHEIDPPPRPSLPPQGFFPYHLAPPPHYDGNPRSWVVHGTGVGGTPALPGRAFRQLPPPLSSAPGRVPAPAPPRRRVPSPPPPAPVPRRPSAAPAIDPGDYFTGGDLSSLVEELTQNDRPGPAPAATSAIDSLPTVRITSTHMSDDGGGSQCPVCKEDFELGEAARLLPCKHVYHSDCIVPWLRLHNSCPVCRFQLPGGAASNARRGSGTNNNGGRGGDNGGQAGQREPPTMVRWGPLSWMWPPRGTEDPDDGWEYGRHGHGHAHGRPDAGDAGGNDLSALQSFVVVAISVFFFSFFV